MNFVTKDLQVANGSLPCVCIYYAVSYNLDEHVLSVQLQISCGKNWKGPSEEYRETKIVLTSTGMCVHSHTHAHMHAACNIFLRELVLSRRTIVCF
jgi:hypothetical protein